MNDIIFKVGERKVSSLEDLKIAVEKAGKEGKPLKLGWIQKGERKTAALHPKGPEQTKSTEKHTVPAMTGIERRMMERLDRQQKEIEALRRQVEELRPQRMMKNRNPTKRLQPNKSQPAQLSE